MKRNYGKTYILALIFTVTGVTASVPNALGDERGISAVSGERHGDTIYLRVSSRDPISGSGCILGRRESRSLSDALKHRHNAAQY